MYRNTAQTTSPTVTLSEPPANTALAPAAAAAAAFAQPIETAELHIPSRVLGTTNLQHHGHNGIHI